MLIDLGIFYLFFYNYYFFGFILLQHYCQKPSMYIFVFLHPFCPGQQWRTDGISNITYEAQEKSIIFGMGAFYTVALLQDAHLNLPYQAWELQPTGVDEGLFTVTAVFATIQIQIKVL